MRFVVTGASGHIGNNVVRALNDAFPDGEVVVLARRAIHRELQGTKCTQVIGDLSDPTFLRLHITEGDYVIHAAGFVDLSGKKKDETYLVNFALTKRITDVCLAQKVARYVYFGSVDGVAKPKDATPISEPLCYDATPISGDYGKSKALAMEYVRKVTEENPDFPGIILLPSAVLGVHDYKPSPIGRVLRGILSGRAEFGIRGGYNFVDVRDVAEAVVQACRTRVRGSYLLAGENVTVEELYRMANEILGFKKKPILLPVFVAWLAMPFVSVLNPVTLRALRESHNYHTAAAREALNFTARPFCETLADTLAWLQENK